MLPLNIEHSIESWNGVSKIKKHNFSHQNKNYSQCHHPMISREKHHITWKNWFHVIMWPSHSRETEFRDNQGVKSRDVMSRFVTFRQTLFPYTGRRRPCTVFKGSNELVSAFLFDWISFTMTWKKKNSTSRKWNVVWGNSLYKYECLVTILLLQDHVSECVETKLSGRVGLVRGGRCCSSLVWVI